MFSDVLENAKNTNADCRVCPPILSAGEQIFLALAGAVSQHLKVQGHSELVARSSCKIGVVAAAGACLHAGRDEGGHEQGAPGRGVAVCQLEVPLANLHVRQQPGASVSQAVSSREEDNGTPPTSWGRHFYDRQRVQQCAGRLRQIMATA